MRRRKFVAAVGATGSVILTGCSSNNGSNGEGAVDGNSRNNIPFDINIKDGYVEATFERDTEIAALQAINEDGSEIGTAYIGDGAETRVVLMPTGIGTSEANVNAEYRTSLRRHIDETIEIVALSESDEVLGTTEITYSPDVEILETTIDSQQNMILSDVKNTGNGPINVNASLNIEDSKNIQPAELETSTDPKIEFRNPSSEGISIPKTTPEFNSSGSIVNKGEQGTISTEYQTVGVGDKGGIGGWNFFDAIYGSIESIADIERDILISGTYTVNYTGGDKKFDIELMINGLRTEFEVTGSFYEEGDTAQTDIYYIPKEITLEELTEK